VPSLSFGFRRLQGIEPPQMEEIEQTLLQFALDNSNKPYESNIIELARGFFKANKKEDNQSFFCSELVAAGWKSIGVLGSDQISSNFLPRQFAKKKMRLENSFTLSSIIEYKDWIDPEKKLRTVIISNDLRSTTSSIEEDRNNLNNFKFSGRVPKKVRSQDLDKVQEISPSSPSKAKHVIFQSPRNRTKRESVDPSKIFIRQSSVPVMPKKISTKKKTEGHPAVLQKTNSLIFKRPIPRESIQEEEKITPREENNSPLPPRAQTQAKIPKFTLNNLDRKNESGKDSGKHAFPRRYSAIDVSITTTSTKVAATRMKSVSTNNNS